MAWKLGAARDLPVSGTESWDGGGAAAAIFAWAGGDDFDPAKARKGFLVYDDEDTSLRGNYKLPFAKPVNGTLTAIKGGINAAASRLPQTDVPDDVKERARAVLDAYQAKLEEESKAKPSRTIEYRTYDVRALDDDRGDGFDGYASTWWAVDSYQTAMAPGAFRKTLRERGEKIPLLWQHWPDKPIGRPTSLKEDKTGLAFEGRVTTATNHGAEAMALLRDGVPLGMSFGFKTLKDRSAEDDDPLDFNQSKGLKAADVRVITEVQLWELSLVTFPANEAAAISAVREHTELAALSTLLDAIRGDDLDEGRAALVQQIVAAYEARAGADACHSTPERARQTNPLTYLSYLTAEHGYLLGEHTWQS